MWNICARYTFRIIIIIIIIIKIFFVFYFNPHNYTDSCRCTCVRVHRSALVIVTTNHIISSARLPHPYARGIRIVRLPWLMSIAVTTLDTTKKQPTPSVNKCC